MSVLVECVPNFSEGRDEQTVRLLAEAIASVARVRVLDTHSDPDHNRSVITFAGDPDGVVEAAARAAGEAAARIDLTRHRGEHPRIGAADVIPFVPLSGVTLEHCIALAHRAGRQIWERFRVPVYFYGAAALRPERANLAAIRRGGFEKLRVEAARDAERRPDVGGPELHPTAGAAGVGARGILIAFNVNLESADVEIARRIAGAVRESSGGLPGVKALGMLLRSRTAGGEAGQAQVSMNLTDWKQTSIRKAYEAVEREASRQGVAIAGSEIVGLTPEAALEGASPPSLRLIGFGPHKILERRLAEAFGVELRIG